MEASDMKDKLKDIIALLGWHGTMTCSQLDCGKPVRYSVLDASFVTGNAEAESLRCASGHAAGGGDLSVGHDERYRSMFQDAIALSVNYYYPNLSDAAVVLAHASLELFLSKVIEYQLKKRKVEEGITRFILDDMKPNMRAYGELLDRLGIMVQKLKEGKPLVEVPVTKTDEWKSLHEVSRIRDDVVHRGIYPSDEEVLLVFERIARAFTNLSEHYLSPFDEGSRARQQPEEI